jgi:NAD(P)-dependent dehydrogenase (short-subunit alcohol dehydrogenase family)
MGQPEQHRSVLVTGAGSGIGQGIAERLARAGFRVIGTTRDAARSQALEDDARAAGWMARFVPLELASPASIHALAERIAADGGLDVLVLNAGFGVFGAVEDVDADLAARQFAVNVLGPLELTRRLLPGLRERRGRVIWIGSLAGRISLPFQAHYSATKAAVAAVSDALRIELRPHGVGVTCIEPGDFATRFASARTIAAVPGSAYRNAHARCLTAVETQERSAPSPEWVARIVEEVCRHPCPPARRPVGTLARTMCVVLRLVPDRVREVIVRAHYAQ